MGESAEHDATEPFGRIGRISAESSSGIFEQLRGGGLHRSVASGRLPRQPFFSRLRAKYETGFQSNLPWSLGSKSRVIDSRLINDGASSGNSKPLNSGSSVK
ncbi:MAG: hypothetical protein R3C53_21860 [Pirellulaceae bacterium]